MHPIADFYNIEGQIQNAFKAVLNAGLTYSPVPTVYLAQYNTVAGTPRIEMRLTNVARGGIHVGPNGELDLWNFDSEIDVITDRTVTPAQNHGQLRGMVRYLCSKEAGKFQAAAITPTLTYWAILDLEASGATVDVESDEREDRTTLRYRGQIGALPQSFPATIP